MPRSPHATDFTVDVDRLGRFTFARRTIGDQFKIRGRYNQITDGFYDADGNMADMSALAYVTIQTLLVSAPSGFDLDALDPLIDDEFETKIVAIWRALRQKELSFRPQPNQGSEAAGAAACEHVSPVVPR